MKSDNCKPSRFFKDGLLVYSSGSLHHQSHQMRGWLYKKAETDKFFQKSKYYKRYFVVKADSIFVAISDTEVSRSFKKVLIENIVCITNIEENEKGPVAKSGEKWMHKFELRTTERTYELFAKNEEERDIWVNGFQRIHKIPVDGVHNKIEVIKRRQSDSQEAQINNDHKSYNRLD